MGALSTHVLDTTRGKPGHGIQVTLYRVAGDQKTMLRQLYTNADGRCDEPLASGDEWQKGVYELLFAVGPYFDVLENAPTAGQQRFLDDVVIRFGVADPAQHYHVPLLITPYSYSTYRGS